ncbi:MAG: hypothetical protein O8C67_00270 [Candidatus Methanoperedens sp.]|nr:hypothetical protein [Candidatus Methanoperedens sp.]
MTDIDAYIQVTAASTWLAAHLVDYASWTAATSDQKAAALIEASDHIDSLSLKGLRYSDPQDREFPRIPPNAAYSGLVPEEVYFQSEPDWSETPQEIEDACCLEALTILDIALTAFKIGLQQNETLDSRNGRSRLNLF